MCRPAALGAFFVAVQLPCAGHAARGVKLDPVRVKVFQLMFKGGRALPHGTSVAHAAYPAGTSRKQALEQTREASRKWHRLIREAVYGASDETLQQLLTILEDPSTSVVIKEGLRHADEGTLKQLDRLLTVGGLAKQCISYNYGAEGKFLALSLGSLDPACRMQAVFTGAVRHSEARGTGGGPSALGQLITRAANQRALGR